MPLIDLTGKRFGKLIVVKKDINSRPKKIRWICQCDCGSKEKSISVSNLKSGQTKSCGCIRKGMNTKEMTGKRINKLIVIRKHGYNKSGQATWLCKCDCGSTSIVDGNRLRTGRVKSCGCTKGINHRMSNHPLYGVWYDMNFRCSHLNGKNRTYIDKNIKVCDDWRRTPIEFIKWAENNGYSDGLQLDRIDNDGDYEPKNCRFVSNRENTLNKNSLRRDNKIGYIGVNRRDKKFTSRITRFGKAIHIGTFETPIEAAIARDLYIMTNFPEDGYPLNVHLSKGLK